MIANRWSSGAMWSMPTLAVRLYPQYLGWALPYSIGSKALREFRIVLPPLTFISDPHFHVGRHKLVEVVATVAVLDDGCASVRACQARRLPAERDLARCTRQKAVAKTVR